MDVTLPDGTVIADVPDGTSKQDLVDKLARNGYDTRKLGMTSEATAYRPEGSVTAPNIQEQFIGGAKHAWDKGAMGLKDFATKVVGTIPEAVREGGSVKKLWADSTLSPEDQELLDRGKAFAHETGPASTIGEVAGDIAMTAAPATKLYGGAKAALEYAPRIFQRALALAPAAVSGAVPMAVVTPGGLAERGQAAAEGAVGGTLGEVGGRVLAKTLGGLITPSAAGKQLMEQGIQPTVGQGAQSSFIHGAEDLAAGIPFTGNLVRSGQRAAQKKAEEYFLTEGIPLDQFPPQLIDRLNAASTLREKVAALGDMSSHVYETNIARIPPIDITPDFKAALGQLRDKVPASARADFEEVLASHLADNKHLTGEQLHNLTTDLGDVAQDYLTSERASDKRAGRALQSMQGQLKEMFFGTSLKEVDDAYANLARIRRAASYLGTSEGLTPKHMERAVRAESGRTPFAEGQARMQGLSDPAQALRVSPNSGMSLLATGGAGGLAALTGMSIPAAIAAALSTAGAIPQVAKAAFGQYPKQQALAEALRRTRGAQAATGAALAEQQNKPKPLNEY